MSPHYFVKCETFFHPTEGNIPFLQTLMTLKRIGCDVWQMECQASNVTASVQSDHLLHGYMLPVFFATDQLHRPSRSAENRPMFQQDTSESHLYCGLVLDTCTLATCPRRRYLSG